jgi:hypothetical protein
MSHGADEKKYPSVDEFRGWYNLGYDREDGWPVLNSSEPMLPFESCEVHHFYIAECGWFDELVPAAARLPFDPLDDPPIFLRGDADDRTVAVDADFRYVTLDLVQRIQKDFLKRHPLRRVILIAEESTASIVIYPRAVRFGNWPLDADAEEALRAVARRAIAAREKRLRPARVQLAHLESRLPDAVQAIGEEPFQVVCVLDCNRRDYSRLTIFILVRGPDDDIIDVDGPPGSDDSFLINGSAYGVDAQGRIISAIAVPESAPFCVCWRCPPADYRGPLTITNRETGVQYTYEVKSENIIHVEPDV